MQNKQAFTLIELLVVVLIIGILAAVAVPLYKKAVEKARMAEVYSLLSSLYPAQQAYYLANGKFTKDFSELDIDFPYDDTPLNDTFDFVGGNYTWHKCVEGECLFAFKEYNEGAYGLQIYFESIPLYGVNAGEIVCLADADDKALEMCQAMGFSNQPFATANLSRQAFSRNAKYYKKL